MDKITGFSDDELLVKILSFLPTKDAVSTSILSKQWKFLWMRVPKLDFDERTIDSRRIIEQSSEKGDSTTSSLVLEKFQRMRRFINKNLPLHSSPVLKSLRLRFFITTVFQPEDIKSWVEIAVSRCVQELSVSYLPFKGKRYALMPSGLYACNSLVTLKLIYRILVDVPHVLCLPSLKTLHLHHVKYADEESLQRLLSNCPVLEDLVVERRDGNNVTKFAVIIPSLRSLSIAISGQCSYVIDTPFLKYFKAIDSSQSSSCLIKNMPKLEEADINAYGSHKIKKFLEPVTSVKRLSLRIRDNNAEVVYGDDIVFNELKHLKFCIQKTYWSKLLLWLLHASPKLRDLRFDEIVPGKDTLVCWKQLTSIPQCLFRVYKLLSGQVTMSS